MGGGAPSVGGGCRRLHLQWVPSHCGLRGNERGRVGRSPSGRGSCGRQDGGPGGSQGGEIKGLQAAPQRVVPRSDGGSARRRRSSTWTGSRRWTSTNCGPATGRDPPSIFTEMARSRPRCAPDAMTYTVRRVCASSAVRRRTSRGTSCYDARH